MITTIREFLKGYKTYIVAAVSVVTAAVGWADGSLTAFAALQMILAALGVSALRAGVEKNK